MIHRHFRQSNIELDRPQIVFISAPAVKQVNLMSSLDHLFQNDVELVSGIYTVLFLRKPVLGRAEAESN